MTSHRKIVNGRVRRLRRKKQDLDKLYNVRDIVIGFDYWYFKLLNYILGIYQYEGLPDSLPQRELELNLMLTGHAAIFESKGRILTTITELYGFDEYYRPTNATFGNALIPFKNLTFGKDAEKRKCVTLDVCVRAESLRSFLEKNGVIRRFGF